MTTAEAIERAERVMLVLANSASRESVFTLAHELQDVWSSGFEEGLDVGRAEGWDMLMEQG